MVHDVSHQGSSDSRPKLQNKLKGGSLTDGPERTVALLKKALEPVVQIFPRNL